VTGVQTCALPIYRRSAKITGVHASAILREWTSHDLGHPPARKGET
jgi:hypothetical protein